MKFRFISLIALLLGLSVTGAAESADDLWNQMFKVLYVGPGIDKQTQVARLEALIKKGANVNEPISFDRMARVGETRADLRPTGWPLDVAIIHGRLDLMNVLLTNGAVLHGAELSKAARYGTADESLAMVKILLKAGANANARYEGFTALHWAAYKGNRESLKLLLAVQGLQLDVHDPDGRTALMTLAEKGDSEMVELLLSAGASVEPAGHRGETAISLAQKTLARQQKAMEQQEEIIANLQARAK